jgi:hypothetical protein
LVLPALSFAVTASVGELLVPLPQLNAFETYGPPLGVETVVAAKLHPVAVPASAPKVLEAGADVASVTAFCTSNEPALEPW